MSWSVTCGLLLYVQFITGTCQVPPDATTNHPAGVPPWGPASKVPTNRLYRRHSRSAEDMSLHVGASGSTLRSSRTLMTPKRMRKHRSST